MSALMSQFALEQIILFAVLLAVAIRGVVDFILWFRGRMKARVHEQERPEELQKQLEQIEATHCAHIESLKAKDELLQKDIDNVATDVKLLIESDKSSILAWITQQHHYFLRMGWIDDFSLMTIEKRFKYYKEEGGNSFAEDLMHDLRKLPKNPPEKLNSDL